MKLMRWAICLAVFAVAGGVATAEDVDFDIGALQAKLAAQEARLNDLQAKVYGDAGGEAGGIVAEGITSLRKNATVTIGGVVNTRYDYFKGKVETKFVDEASALGAKRVKTQDIRYGDLNIADAKLEGKIDVNEYFDAYFQFDLQDGSRGNDDMDSPANVAQNYWVRWKNVCNSGFGVLVGRDGIKFGGTQPYGRYDSWVAGNDDMSGNIWGDAWLSGSTFTGMAIGGGGMPLRSALYADSRTVQVTPYWETQDGKFKAEVSFFQGVEYYGASATNRHRDGYIKERKSNDGVGSFSARLSWQPIDGLSLNGSVMNLHAKHQGGLFGYPSSDGWEEDTAFRTSKNNFSTNIGIEYRPEFFNKLNVFATWTHGWNDGWIKDQDGDSLSFGFGFDITDRLTFYASAEHVRAKSAQAWAVHNAGFDYNVHKASGWANELGLKYEFPYGVSLDAGWRHERMTYKNVAGNKHTKLTGDAFWTTLGFEF